MEAQKIKNYLHQIAEQVTDSTTLEDVYKELSLLADIEESEEDELRGNVYRQSDVENMSKQWLK